MTRSQTPTPWRARDPPRAAAAASIEDCQEPYAAAASIQDCQEAYQAPLDCGAERWRVWMRNANAILEDFSRSFIYSFLLLGGFVSYSYSQQLHVLVV